MPPKAKKQNKYIPLQRSSSTQAAALKQKARGTIAQRPLTLAQGSNAFTDGNYDLALEHYLDAHGHDPSPILLSNAATSQSELGNYHECLALCELALMSSAIDDPEMAAIRAKLMIREYRSLGLLRKWYRAEMSCDRMIAAQADGSIQDPATEAAERFVELASDRS